MDLFEKWLRKKDESKWVKRALTDPSFNSYRCRGINLKNPRFRESHTPLPVNSDLATYGDAVIKLCYLELMLDNVERPTEEKSKVESDKYLVDTVARHYGLLAHIDKDVSDKGMPDDYDYEAHEGTNRNPCKYIATAVEAMIGAIYKETRDLDSIVKLLEAWESWRE